MLLHAAIVERLPEKKKLRSVICSWSSASSELRFHLRNCCRFPSGTGPHGRNLAHQAASVRIEERGVSYYMNQPDKSLDASRAAERGAGEAERDGRKNSKSR